MFTRAKREAHGRISRRSLLKGGAAAGAAIGAGGLVLKRAAADELVGLGLDPGVPSGRVREYWIQADSFHHNLVPSGTDQMSGRTFDPDGSSYWALGYRAYTEGWGRPLPGGDELGPNTGIPGPVLRAQVGDQMKIHFRNNDTHYRWPHSLHPHGLLYDPASDGAYKGRPGPGTAVPFGETYTYTWTAVASSVGTWPYHDHSVPQAIKGDPIMELGAELGLFGIIAVTDRHTERVDREIILFFHDLYQSDIPSLSQDFDAFNGACYLGNTPELTATVGERVRWRIATLGKEMHVFHLHGHRWRSQQSQRFADSEILGPSTALTIDYLEDNPGEWLYHCHVVDHMMGGMVGAYRVTSTATPPPAP